MPHNITQVTHYITQIPPSDMSPRNILIMTTFWKNNDKQRKCHKKYGYPVKEWKGIERNVTKIDGMEYYRIEYEGKE